MNHQNRKPKHGNSNDTQSETAFATASSLARAVAKGDRNCVEVVKNALNHIDRVNPALNAVVQLDHEAALRQAAEADEYQRSGGKLGPLHGVPITIKDSLNTAKLITTGGTEGLSGHVPKSDATAVARLRGAGAIVVGKTNTPEFTLSFETSNSVYGPTFNPHDVTRSPGGSSGGAAAILAAGGPALDVGSDYGGSIRLPSHYCGIAGIKPTAGRVPRTGHAFPFGGVNDSFQQLGPMARSVEDLVLALPLLAGPDGIDPAIVPMTLGDPHEVSPDGLRVGFYETTDFCPATQPVRHTVRKAAEHLETLGCIVEEVPTPWFEEAFETCSAMFFADGGAAIEHLLAKAGTQGSQLETRLHDGLPARELAALVHQWFDLRSRLSQVFASVDLILSPPNARTAPPSGWAHASENYTAFSYTMLHNLTGWPSGVVRCGEDERALPVGVQVTSHPAQEHLILAGMRWLEDAFGGYQRPARADA